MDSEKQAAPLEGKSYTHEDMQRARREGFTDGAWWQFNNKGADWGNVSEEVRRRYPIKKVPRVVKIGALFARLEECGSFSDIPAIVLYLDRECTRPHRPDFITPEFTEGFVALLANPYTE